MQSDKIIEYIINWMENYAEKSCSKGFIIGVSGGIDSAVVSSIAARTNKEVLLLEIPIRQKSDQVTRAQEHIAFLRSRFPKIRSFCIDLTPTFESFEKTISLTGNLPYHFLAMANSRSRLRMTLLYYYAQVYGLLVTGTGNKIEDFGIGFFTKYGDGGVDILPIADLTKTQVYSLAKDLDIIQSIQDAVPTDGLWDTERTDEQQIGASYPELEWAMKLHDTHKADDFDGRQRVVFEIYDRLNKAARHKMNPIPVCKIPDELKF